MYGNYDMLTLSFALFAVADAGVVFAANNPGFR
jgi:hypothetical protein